MGEEASDMNRNRPSGSRARLDPVAVWELLDQLGMTQKQLACKC